jgi:shikimate dehydrogenase
VLRAAAARGLATVDGLGMLVWQAALAFERWLGAPAPIEAMRRAAEQGA